MVSGSAQARIVVAQHHALPLAHVQQRGYFNDVKKKKKHELGKRMVLALMRATGYAILERQKRRIGRKT